METFIEDFEVGCVLCKKTSNHIVWRENGFLGHLCDCGLMYSSKAQPSTVVPPLDAEGHDRSFYSLPAQLKARWMHKMCGVGEVLEVGCGEGYFLHAAQSLGYKVHGLEPNEVRASAAANRTGAPITRGWIEENSLPESTFDIVFHIDLLAHFPDPLRALMSMIRLLRPGGVLCFEVGTLSDVSTFWYRRIGGIGLNRHRQLFSHRSIDKLLTLAGLEVVEKQEFGLSPAVLLHVPVACSIMYALRPLLHMFRHPDAATRSLELRDHALYQLRYGLGRLAPRWGPTTKLIVARPSGR